MHEGETKILVVEDDTINAIVLKNYLRDFEVSVETKASKALELLKTYYYDIVVLDINLSDENITGIVLAKEAKKSNKDYNKSYFIAVTGYSMAQDQTIILNNGFDAYFAKPIEKLELVQKVKEFIGKNKNKSKVSGLN